MTDDRPFRVPGLDGLRAIAVAVVMVFHLVPGVLPGGYLGVDVFFVVSGFIITTLLLREHAARGRIALGSFWVRRARRLLPALALLLLACGTAAAFVGGDVLVRLGVQVIGAATFSANWALIGFGGDYFDATVPELFRNLWSLAVEEQFYLVWPLLLAAVLIRMPRWLRLVLIAAIAAASAAWMHALWTPLDVTRVYYGTDTHAFGLAIGAFVAVLAAGRAGFAPARWVRALAVVAAGLAIAGLGALSVLMTEDVPWAFPGGLLAVSGLTATAITGCLVAGSPVARALDLAPVRWVGERSYGLYLWHWPVMVLLAQAMPTWPRQGAEGWAFGGIALAVTVVAAVASYRFVEQPVRRDGFRSTLRRILDVPPRSRQAAAASLAVVLVAGAGATTIAAIASDPGRGEVEALVEAGRDAIDTPHQPVATDDGPRLAGGDQITAIGDSVMLAAAPALQHEFPGISIDAQVSRSMYVAPDIIRAKLAAGDLRPVVVLALGTNGPISRATLEEVRALLGPDRQLVVVNAQAPRGWIPGVNAELAAFAQYYRDVELANWHAAIQPRLGLLARDQVHFGSDGAAVFVATIRDALQRLAELPPLRDEAADLSLPRPF